ncbi:MAG TPA: Asp-tRNA(Asn)/Glu-tRNA(Gln) amidotransferase subunit GatC [Anaerolineales bacterium]|nr:Asp-tRNA(Asn)/Glu-tRNA(Gln) amidotransferase subunit GatC [Anaerolineales bacterium]
MPLTHEEVAHIARLARLNLTPDELERYRGQLSAILDYFAELSALDTTGVEPTARVREGEQALRADESRPGLGAGRLAETAPDWHDDQFRVPPIFE